MKSCSGWADADDMFFNFIEFNKGHCFVWYAGVSDLASAGPQSVDSPRVRLV